MISMNNTSFMVRHLVCSNRTPDSLNLRRMKSNTALILIIDKLSSLQVTLLEKLLSSLDRGQRLKKTKIYSSQVHMVLAGCCLIHSYNSPNHSSPTKYFVELSGHSTYSTATFQYFITQISTRNAFVMRSKFIHINIQLVSCYNNRRILHLDVLPNIHHYEE